MFRLHSHPQSHSCSPFSPSARKRGLIFKTALFLIANFGLFVDGNAQNDAKNKTPEAAVPCPSAATFSQQHLYGNWTLKWLPATPAANSTAGSAASPTSVALPRPASTRLALSANPEYPDSLIGTMAVGTQRHVLAGDLEEGVLTLEESADGKSISANWAGRLVPESCGREIRGTWLSANDRVQWGFVLRRVVGW